MPVVRLTANTVTTLKQPAEMDDVTAAFRRRCHLMTAVIAATILVERTHQQF